MKTFYYDCSWRGGVVVMAENEQKALELIKNNSVNYKEGMKLTILEPNQVYTFMGDS